MMNYADLSLINTANYLKTIFQNLFYLKLALIFGHMFIFILLLKTIKNKKCKIHFKDEICLFLKVVINKKMILTHQFVLLI